MPCEHDDSPAATDRPEDLPPWPPRVGEPLPRAAEAVGVRDKLATYSLDLAHEIGGPKAEGFERILGITIEDIDYLEGAILTGILTVPVSSIRENPPWGLNGVVMLPVRGRGKKHGRVVKVRTVWRLADPEAAPQLASAFPKP